MAIQTTTAGRNSEYHGELVIHSTQSGYDSLLCLEILMSPFLSTSTIPILFIIDLNHEYTSIVHRRQVLQRLG